MRVLWVTAQVLPLVAGQLNIRAEGFGGWVMNMLNQLEKLPDIQLGVAMVSDKVSEINVSTVRNIECFVAPDKGKKSISESDRDSIINGFSPDIIHIEGNEFQIHNMFSKCKSVPVLLSLQGILSGYEPYQYGELPISDYMFDLSEHNVISAWILFFRKHLLFKKRINIENDTIANVRYISGRTFWDRAHSYWINPNAEYFVCNRILRDAFYSEQWCHGNMEKHSIFVGNGYSPLKGLHFVIDALALLVKEFQDVKLYVAGNCPIIKKKGLSLHKLGYGRLIEKKIKKYGLEDKIVFTGSINEFEMIERMKHCNVYVLPSLIENSPNTLGEAMILGMPCVSAYTGGASEMARDEEECLFYRANDPKLLAWQLRRIFLDEDMAAKLGEKARLHAMITHDSANNRDMLVKAYKTILECKNKV